MVLPLAKKGFGQFGLSGRLDILLEYPESAENNHLSSTVFSISLTSTPNKGQKCQIAPCYLPIYEITTMAYLKTASCSKMSTYLLSILIPNAQPYFKKCLCWSKTQNTLAKLYPVIKEVNSYRDAADLMPPKAVFHAFLF